MPTTQQKKAFEVWSEALANEKPIPITRAMERAGYSVKTRGKPQQLTKSKGWQELLNEIPDSLITTELKKLIKDKTDKRAKLQAMDMALKLKDKYPAGKLKITGYREELEGL